MTQDATPKPQVISGGQTEKQLAQWMQQQQNRIDDELKIIRQSMTKVEKNISILAERSVHVNKKLDENSNDLKQVSSKLDALSTRIAIAAAVVVAIGVVLTFIFGSNLSDIMKGIEALSSVKKP